MLGHPQRRAGRTLSTSKYRMVYHIGVLPVLVVLTVRERELGVAFFCKRGKGVLSEGELLLWGWFFLDSGNWSVVLSMRTLLL